MIVVDANVIVYAVFATPQTPLVERLSAKDADWRLPTLWKHEVASAATTFVRVGQATIDQARAAIAAATALVAGREVEVDLAKAVEIALQYNLSAYDAQYIVLALATGIRCVTADQKVVKNAPAIAIDLKDFVS